MTPIRGFFGAVSVRYCATMHQPSLPFFGSGRGGEGGAQKRDETRARLLRMCGVCKRSKLCNGHTLLARCSARYTSARCTHARAGAFHLFRWRAGASRSCAVLPCGQNFTFTFTVGYLRCGGANRSFLSTVCLSAQCGTLPNSNSALQRFSAPERARVWFGLREETPARHDTERSRRLWSPSRKTRLRVPPVRPAARFRIETDDPRAAASGVAVREGAFAARARCSRSASGGECCV